MRRRVAKVLVMFGVACALSTSAVLAGGSHRAGGAGRIIFASGHVKRCDGGDCFPSLDVVRAIGPHGGRSGVFTEARSVKEISATDDGTRTAILSKVVTNRPFTQIYLVSGSGKRTEVFPHRLDGFNATGLSISDNGKLLAITGRRSSGGGASRVWIVKPNGSGMREVTDGTAGEDDMPALSPNGKRVVFSRTTNGNSPSTRDAELFVVGTAGGTPKRLTNNAVDDVNPVYSPSGNTLSFGESPKRGAGTVATMSAGGGVVHKVTSTGLVFPDPDYSPNGQNLAFIGDVPGGDRFDSGIYTIRASGKNRRLVSKAFEFPGLPAWTLRP